MQNPYSEIRIPKSEIIRVLLIEDDPGYARLIREILKEASAAQFDLAHVERLGEEAFDVMLLDLNLPDSQGLHTFVRAHAQAHELRTSAVRIRLKGDSGPAAGQKVEVRRVGAAGSRLRWYPAHAA